MARIAGVNIPKDKKICIALTYICGIGRCSAIKICDLASVDVNIRTYKLGDDEIAKINEVISENFSVEGDLRRTVNMNIRRLRDLGCYRGIMHGKGLPVRGQRTHTNAKTRRGRNRKPIAGKKKK